MLDGYDMLREVLAELGLELTGTTMSYHQREPRGGGPVAASEVDECAAWVAAAAVPGDPDILAARPAASTSRASTLPASGLA